MNLKTKIMSGRGKIAALTLVLLLILCVPEGKAMAQAAVVNGLAAKGQQGIDVRSIASVFSTLNTFMHIVTLVAMQFLQYLLQSDFFSSGPMMDALNRIWQMSRDVMNILFAVMLIGVAFYTIVTGDKKYVAEKLQSFVMAVILVNFSWFFPRVIIDVANVLTATIYTVPDIMTGGFSCTAWDDAGNAVPCKGLTDVKLLPESVAAGELYCRGLPADRCSCVAGIACYKTDTLQALRAGGATGVGHVMLNGLLINYTKFMNLIKIPTTLAGPAPVAGTAWEGFMTTMRILMGILVAFTVQLAIFLPIVALTGVLLVRILVIWITTAFMPFAFLGYVVNGKLGTGGIVKGMDFDIWEQFIGAAFLPTIVAVPITIGFIMLTAVTRVPAPAVFMGGMDIPLIFGVRTWWGMLWMLASVVILWKGAFMALKTNQFASSFVEKVEGFGNMMASSAMKLPMLTPLPMGGNIGGLVNQAKLVPGAIDMATSGKAKSLNEAFSTLRGQGGTSPIPGTTLQETGKLITDKNTQTIVDAITKLGKDTLSGAERANEFEKLRSTLKVNNAVSGVQMLEQLKGIANNPAINKNFSDAVKNAGADIQKAITESMKQK